MNYFCITETALDDFNGFYIVLQMLCKRPKNYYLMHNILKISSNTLKIVKDSPTIAKFLQSLHTGNF